jgi:hypothetical protein
MIPDGNDESRRLKSSIAVLRFLPCLMVYAISAVQCISIHRWRNPRNTDKPGAVCL